MNREDAARLLTIACAYDGRLKPPTKRDAEVRAHAWSVALDSRMPLEWAEQAVIAHYSESTEAMMPAHLNRGFWSYRKTQLDLDAAKKTRLELEAVEAVPMPDEIKAQLDALRVKWASQ
jgi:hypothetical protein